MKATTKARAIHELLTAAAEIAGDVARDLADASEIVTAPAGINEMVGVVMGQEPAVGQLADIFTAILALQKVAVES